MSMFAQYARKAKEAARAPLAMTSEADPLANLPVDVADESTKPVEGEDAPVIVDQFAQARQNLNLTHHNLIRARSEVAQVDEVVEEPVLDVEDAPEVPEVTEEVVDAPVDVVPEGEEIPEEPALEVTADEADVADATVDVDVDAPVVEGEEIEPAVVIADEVVEDAPAAEEVVPETIDEAAAVVEDVPVEAPADVVPEVVEEPVVEPVADDVAEVEDAPEVPAEDLPATEEPAVDVVEVEDEEVIEDEDAPAEEEVIDEVGADAAEIEDLETEMQMLTQSMIAIETYGVNPTAISILKTTGLLNGTAIESLGLEAFGYEAGNHPESQMALEALGEKVKEKAAQWSAKILAVATTVGTKVMSALEAIWDKTKSATARITSAAWDKAKAAGKVVKAHPYKTIIGVISAIAAVAGVCVFGGQYLPALSAPGQAVTKFTTAMVAKINAIKWPFGSITAKVAEGGAKFVTTVETGATAAKGVAIESLDWTASMVKAAGGQIGRAWNATKTGVTAFGTRATKVGNSVKTTMASAAKFTEDAVGSTTLLVRAKSAKAMGSAKAGAAVAGVYGMVAVNAITSAAMSLVKLLYRVVAAGLRIITNTFNALAGAVGAKAVAA